MQILSSAATPTLPREQVNAVLSDSLQMRIGIPHKGGRLAFHAFNEDYPAMVSANAFWNRGKGRFQVPEATDLQELDFALDSGGFTAMQLWKRLGRQSGMAGIFPWTYSQYLELVSDLNPAWYSQPDLCVERELVTSQEETDYRINATATLLEGVLRVVYDWQCELAKTCSPSVVANMVRPPVPVLQGWTADDYLRSLDLMQEVWSRWQPWLADPVLIGIGSVCRRDLHHPKFGLFAILSALEGRIPPGAKVHLFGVKGTCLSKIKMMDWIASADSMAYDFQSRIQSRKEGVSNTVLRRSAEMSQWMQRATRQLAPCAGDQFRLAL